MLVISSLFFAATAFASPASPSAGKTVLDIVLSSPVHTTLAKLAGSLPAVTDVLSSSGPLTLFAPTDEAFARLPSAIVQAVTTDATLLASVLDYHVLAGTAFVPSNKPERLFVETAEGSTLRVDVSQGPKVALSYGLGASNVTASVVASNGIVHIVDTVLQLPAAASKTAVDAKLSKLVAALSKENLVQTVDSLTKVTVFAPIDAAFEALDRFDAVFGISLSDQILASILKTHIVPQVVYSTDVSRAGTPFTFVHSFALLL